MSAGTATLLGLTASEVLPGDRVLIASGVALVLRVGVLARSHVLEPQRVALHTAERVHVVPASMRLVVERDRSACPSHAPRGLSSRCCDLRAGHMDTPGVARHEWDDDGEVWAVDSPSFGARTHEGDGVAP